jgi:Flp pilus assembly protein TadD
LQAELYETLGSIYDKLGKFDQADSLLRTALEQRKALFGASSPEVAETLIALGMLRSDQAHLEDAERLVQRAQDDQAKPAGESSGYRKGYCGSRNYRGKSRSVRSGDSSAG